MASLEEFSRRIKIRANLLEENTNKKVRAIALAIDQVLVTETPVDTGRARSNWIVQLGSPARSPIEPYAPGEGLGKGETANAQAAMNQGAAVIGQRRLGQDIYISNNLPYIKKLDEGSSAQAPAGYIDKGIQAGIRAGRKVKLVT